MEKLVFQVKNSFLFKFLPKQPVASFAFQNPSFSPPRSPVSIIPKEARRKHRGGGGSGMSFTAKEPSSPKVSCMGRVQCKKEKKKKMAQKHNGVQVPHNKSDSVLESENNKEEKNVLLSMISKSKQGGKGCVLEEKVEAAPSLGMMKKFASGRATLSRVDFELAQKSSSNM